MWLLFRDIGLVAGSAYNAPTPDIYFLKIGGDEGEEYEKWAITRRGFK